MTIRILLAKPGLDVHDRGIRVVANACRDAGLEVVYLGTGIYTVEQIAAIAAQEDVDVIGLSIMTGRASRICADLAAALATHDAGEVPVVVGGVIRKEEVPALEQLGVAGIFRSGTTLTEIVARIAAVAGGDGAARETA